MLEALLNKVGFSPKEADIYLALLHMGVQPASVIARRVGCNRITTYQILQKLVDRGIVSVENRGNVRFFYAEPPVKLLRYLERRRAKVDTQLAQMHEYLPLFEQLVNPDCITPSARSFSGVRGAHTVFGDSALADDICIMGDYSSDMDELGDYLDRFYLSSDSCDARLKLLFTATSANRKYVEEKNIGKKMYRLAPSSSLSFDTTFILYGKKVALIAFRNGERFCTVIESPSVSHTMRNFFDVLWKMSKGD